MQVDPQREPQKPPAPPAKMALGERELITGLLSKAASFRLIVSGDVGVKEIERLIAKLELDKEILADADAANVENSPADSNAKDATVQAPGKIARVPFMITQAQKAQLREKGYTDEQIGKMKPADAHNALGIGV